MTEFDPEEEFNIVLVRHGESVGNAEGRHQGQADYPLTERGREQVHRLAEYWQEQGKGFDTLISSPLRRARSTAEILSPSLNLEIVLDAQWMERDNGKLAGLLHEEALEKMPPPDFIPLHQPIAETGESQWELYLRAGAALHDLLIRPPGSYLVVGHGGLFNMTMHTVLGLTPQPNFQGARFRFSNTGITDLTYRPGEGSWYVQKHNIRPHLS